MSWICTGFITIMLSKAPIENHSYFLGTFSNQKECLDYGEHWVNKKKSVNVDAEYICEKELKRESDEETIQI